MSNTKTDAKGYLIIFLVIAAILALLFGGGSGSGSRTSASKTCQSCNRTFTDATNKNYITHTHMCKNCYKNFCWAKGMTPKNYDK